MTPVEHKNEGNADLPSFYMTFRDRVLPAGETHHATADHTAIRGLDRAVAIGSPKSDPVDGGYARRLDQVRSVDAGADLHWLEFGLWRLRPPDTDFVALHQVEVPGDTVLLRLDEVAFGPGVSAYRHVHPGAGIRALIAGELTLHTDTDSRIMKTGNAWFEPANSPVRAVASAQEPRTVFVRAMLLPPKYLGQPTIQILDPNDAALPKLQKTHRHFDQIIQVSG